jgi:hypothetical protein
MELKLILLLFMAIICAGIVYVILTRVKSHQRRAVWIRSVLFFGIVSYLTYDFLLKEKYMFLIALALGSIAFIAVMRDMFRKDKSD